MANRTQMVPHSVRLSAEQLTRLRQLAQMTHRTPSHVIRLLIDRAEVVGVGEIRLRPRGEGGDRP
jgi:predicted DNA-binding protein